MSESNVIIKWSIPSSLSTWKNYTETAGSELQKGNNFNTVSCKQTDLETGQENTLKEPRRLAV